MRKFFGWILFIIGIWLFISPQAILGIKELQWMASYSFPGEILFGCMILSGAYYLLNLEVIKK